MYAGTTPRTLGIPLAVVGLFQITGGSLLWFAIAAMLPIIAVLVVGQLLLRQELTEAEALVVEQRTGTQIEPSNSAEHQLAHWVAAGLGERGRDDEPNCSVTDR